jgi:competence protein ComEA
MLGTMPVRYWAAVAGLAASVLGASLWFGRTAPEHMPLELAAIDTQPAGTITVHVAGEVVAPGLVEITENGRVADAIAAAGGSTREADLSRVNLAASLRDGEQIMIPGPASSSGDSSATATDGRVRINFASATELEQLPGVGPVLASRIAAYREENGAFAVVEDLLDVPGIGEGKLATLRDAVALP